MFRYTGVNILFYGHCTLVSSALQVVNNALTRKKHFRAGFENVQKSNNEARITQIIRRLNWCLGLASIMVDPEFDKNATRYP